MIRALGRTTDGSPVVIIGLSENNWRKLSTGGDENLGQPIAFDLAELGLPSMTVVILGGVDDAKLDAIIREWFPGTGEPPR